MRILFVSPLYPPDIAPLAVYVKECARRMSAAQTVSLLVYAHIPELLSDVQIHTVSKNTPRIVRIIRAFFTYMRLVKNTDVVFLQNGVSMELPILLASYILRKRIVFYISDPVPVHSIEKNSFARFIFRTLCNRASSLLCTRELIPKIKNGKWNELAVPLPRPEIMPETAYPKDAFMEYEASWDVHMKKLKTYLIV